VQFENAELLMLLIPFGSVTLISLEQEENAATPMLVTLLPITILTHKPPAINSRASTGCGYRLGCLGAGLLQPVLPEVSAQMRLRSESVEFGPS